MTNSRLKHDQRGAMSILHHSPRWLSTESWCTGRWSLRNVVCRVRQSGGISKPPPHPSSPLDLSFTTLGKAARQATASHRIDPTNAKLRLAHPAHTKCVSRARSGAKPESIAAETPVGAAARRDWQGLAQVSKKKGKWERKQGLVRVQFSTGQDRT